MAATNALAAANMIISGIDVVIPLDETIKAMYDVGIQLPSNLKCTASGGLSITRTAQTIDKKINDLELRKFMIEKAKVGLIEGYKFGQGGEGFQRVNIGCPRSILKKSLERIEKAVNEVCV